MPPPPPKLPSAAFAAAAASTAAADSATSGCASDGRPLIRKAREQCDFCMRFGPDFPPGQTRYQPASEISCTIVLDIEDDGLGDRCDVRGCTSCPVHHCNGRCARRGICPNHWDLSERSPSFEFQCIAYAEVAAGIGCKCQCCTGLLDEWWCDDDQFYDYWWSNGTWIRLNDACCAVAQQDRDVLRAALEAAGNPECHLVSVLAEAETMKAACSAPGNQEEARL